MDNKRKIVGTVLGKGPAKLRKISLNAFEMNEQTQDSQSTDKQADVSSSATATINAPVSDTVDHALEEVVLKTALWISENMDKAGALVEKSKDNPMLAFLGDHHGATPAGRMYLRELQRLKTEKEVQAVCSGVQDAPVVHASQIASFIQQSRLAAEAASGSIHSTWEQPAVAPRERKNRWGPSTTETAHATSAAPSAYHAPVVAVALPTPVQSVPPSTTHAKPSRFGELPSNRDREAPKSEAAQIARLAASFDQPDHAEAAQEDARRQRLVREQQEMQLLESRIRDAASQGLSSSGSGSRGSGGDNKSIIEVAKYLAAHPSSSGGAHPALQMAEKQAALFLERLAQYQELAALHDADEHYRDTVEEAERNRGVIEGGTWEHRKRAKEMLTTATRNLELTLLGSGKHHMADFLPPEVLSAFLKNAEHVSKGTVNTSSGDGDTHTIDASNVGFQLLQKSGWSEGSGLGAHGTGIVNPISANSANNSSGSSAGNVPPIVVQGVNISGGQGPEGAGLGVSATHAVAEGDSEFDQYRKRMMLAYRFRPNPLNNPRRNYY